MNAPRTPVLEIPTAHQHLRAFASTLKGLSDRYGTDTFNEFCTREMANHTDDWKQRANWFQEILDAAFASPERLAVAYHEAGRLDFQAFSSQTAFRPFSDVLDRVYLDPLYPAIEAVDFMFDQSARARLRFSVQVAAGLEEPPVVACDIGIGSGDVLIALAEALPSTHFVCVDVSPIVLNFVKRRLQLRCPGRKFEFVSGDIRSLPLPSAAFDLTVANEVVEHVHESALAIRECARVTRVGKHSIVSTSMRYPSTEHLGEFPTINAFERAMCDAGFCVERLMAVENTLSEHSFVDLFALARKSN